MKTIFWTGYCNNERMKAIGEIEKIIDGYGDITDYKLFSDISISIKIELKEMNIDKLYLALKNYLSLNDFDKLNSTSKAERIIFLNTTFTKATGNLKIEIPAIPG